MPLLLVFTSACSVVIITSCSALLCRETKDKDDVDDTHGTTYSKLKELENDEFDS